MRTASASRRLRSLKAITKDGEGISLLLRERGPGRRSRRRRHDVSAGGRIGAAHPGQRYQGWSALALAVSRNDLSTAQSLLKSGGDINQRTPQGDPLWRVAVDAESPRDAQAAARQWSQPCVGSTAASTGWSDAAAADGPLLDILLSAGVSADAHAAGEEPAAGGVRCRIQPAN